MQISVPHQSATDKIEKSALDKMTLIEVGFWLYLLDNFFSQFIISFKNKEPFHIERGLCGL